MAKDTKHQKEPAKAVVQVPTMSFGNIEETIFFDTSAISPNARDLFWEEVSSFCVDEKGTVRKRLGMVSYDAETDADPEYVPRHRYEIKPSAWNSHSDYVMIELPNPAIDLEKYQKIRAVFMSEIERRLASAPTEKHETDDDI